MRVSSIGTIHNTNFRWDVPKPVHTTTHESLVVTDDTKPVPPEPKKEDKDEQSNNRLR